MLLLTLVCLLAPMYQAQKLGRYSIDTSQITVSGISSGAAMADQLHFAYSKLFSGVGIVAGPPYYCSNGVMTTATTTCMSGLIGTINVNNLQTTINKYNSQGLIDDTSNIFNHNVYIYSGTADYVVKSSVVKKNEELYQRYTPASKIKTVYNIASAHGMITNYFGGSCGIASSNYINNCNYNQAFDILKHLHSNADLVENAKGADLRGRLMEFDQTEFFPTGTSTTNSMDSVGYIYVPPNCVNGRCKLHVALHGCAQGKYKIGDAYARNGGYNQVADQNDFIILYPQVKSNLIKNPNGCWDWWGFTDANFANNKGQQMRAIKSMVDRIVGN